MTFKVVRQGRPYLWPVKVEQAADNGDKTQFNYRAVFKRLPHEEVRQIMDGLGAGDMSDAEACERVLDGWHDVVDEDGNQFEFSKDNLAACISMQGFARDTVLAWMQSVGKGKAKN